MTLSQVRVSERSKTSCVVVLHSSKVCWGVTGGGGGGGGGWGGVQLD